MHVVELGGRGTDCNLVHLLSQQRYGVGAEHECNQRREPKNTGGYVASFAGRFQNDNGVEDMNNPQERQDSGSFVELFHALRQHENDNEALNKGNRL